MDMYEEGSFRRPTPEEIANGVRIPELGEEVFIGTVDDFTKSVEAISQPESEIER